MRKSVYLLFFLFISAFAFANDKVVVKAASEHDYPPFCIVTPDCKADGFSVELLRAALDAVHLDVEFKVGQWAIIKEELKDGAIQVLPLVGRTPKREESYDFTFKYLTLHGAIFIRKGDTRIKTEDDLIDKEILVMKGDNAEEYARRNNVSSKIIAVGTYEEAFKLLAAGKHDAVITQRLMGLQLLKKLKISKVIPLEHNLNSFEQDFSFAVQEGDKELLKALNEGLSIVMADGTFKRLYEEWVVPSMSIPFPLKRMIKYVLIILIIPIAFIIFLREVIKRKTKELRNEIDERKKLDKLHKGSESKLRAFVDSSRDAIANRE